MFATSILENIRYGNPEASMGQVVEAARQANAHSFIETFPDAYNTVVGERGVTLSGGNNKNTERIFRFSQHFLDYKFIAISRSKTANRNR